MLAAERRTSRRLLAKSLLELLRNSKPSQRAVRVHLPVRPGGPHYVFLALADIHSRSESEYRGVRRKLLEALCMVVKLKFPMATDVVGIATEPGLGSERSEDVVWLDARNWPPECQAEAESLQRDLGLLTQCGPEMRGKEYEFPLSETPRGKRKVFASRPATSARNSSCPCGSGRKWKKCCMR